MLGSLPLDALQPITAHQRGNDTPRTEALPLDSAQSNVRHLAVRNQHSHYTRHASLWQTLRRGDGSLGMAAVVLRLLGVPCWLSIVHPSRIGGSGSLQGRSPECGRRLWTLSEAELAAWVAQAPASSLHSSSSMATACRAWSQAQKPTRAGQATLSLACAADAGAGHNIIK